MTAELHIADQISLKAAEESAKLDQFLLGATMAVCAYLAQNNVYMPIGMNRSTVMIGCMLIFATSAALGFMRLNTVVKVYQENAKLVGADNTEDETDYKDECQRLLLSSRRYGHIRNVLLFIGLAYYIAAKVGASYYCQGCMPNLPG
ncbi:hypothetical protein [Pseudomonas petrae]|uniref:hypothetical protein n=1 Tax=Pseudomonas petrae TaxID=2912190 RepID=UPI001EF08E3F|nr:hypothetical protein [Pseudomonas petrae]MCF7535379.1 hypothetical protein [Pseudomonas petrae]MCF7558684.1 hypothetical protein [Pseudomonas petrae]